MPTYVQRELAGVSPINEPALPTESKHNSDEAHRKNHEMALYQKELRELDNYQMMEYKHDLTDVLGNPGDKVRDQLKEGHYRIITEDEAIHTPYKLAA